MEFPSGHVFLRWAADVVSFGRAWHSWIVRFGLTGVTDIMSQTFTMYSTPWCGYCHRLKAQLKREGIEFDEVDIEQVPEAAELVAAANGGNHTVPTLIFSDGSSLTNPSVAEVSQKLGLG